jgi:hypothetical protein
VIQAKESLRKDSKPFSLWRKLVNACSDTEVINVLCNLFKRQFFILIVTLLLAYRAGYFSHEKNDSSEAVARNSNEL